MALLIGLFVCFTTLTSDYASSTCEKAAVDKSAFEEARAKCGSPTTDCYKRATALLTTQDDCDYKKSSMRNQLIMGIVPAVIGALLTVVGFIVFVVGRKKAVA
ncbi:MAG: hypothetical protein LH614_03870 [Pyrinomonadaceae bacterium]|nr:hypothetical protein [Pyrinomonadaceae bacterium]